jgi:hypothetical protein
MIVMATNLYVCVQGVIAHPMIYSECVCDVCVSSGKHALVVSSCAQ